MINMGNNLALNADITASSYVDPYTPGRAANGITDDPTSRWLCGVLPGWLQFDLGVPSWVGQWSVKSMGKDAGWPDNYCMIMLQLESSNDGAQWTTVDAVTDNNSEMYTRVLANPVFARYFRLYVPSEGGIQANKTVASVMELELIEADVSLLTSLAIKDKNGNTVTLTPVFDSDTLSYTANVGFDSDQITVIPVASKTTAAVTVNGQTLVEGKASVNVNTGSNGVEIKVVSAGGNIVTYQVAVTRASSPYLSSVKLVGIRFSGFVKTTYSYNLSVSTLVSTAVTLTTEDPEAAAVISLNGIVYNSGQTIPLINGKNPINIVVTSKTGVDSRTYVFNINKSI